MGQPGHDLRITPLSRSSALGDSAPWVTLGLSLCLVVLGNYLAFSGVIGSEFLPHLDEGALWVRGTLAPSTGPDEGIRVANQARLVLCSFPEVPQCTSQVGRPDDGTDNTGFFNTEYFVDLKPKEQWRPVFHENKDELIAAMQRELDKIPGVVWGFSQPIEDNMEEAVSGVKGALATKIYGDDLKVLEQKSDEMVAIMRKINGIEDLGVFRVLGQPNLNVAVDREAAARYQINVADVQDAVQTAVGGTALTQVLKGEARYDLTLRYLPQFRNTREAIENIRLVSPSGARVSLAQLCKITETDGASEVYREGNRRYVAIKYSVRGRDLGSTVEEAIKKVNEQVKLPNGYSVDWEGEYASQKRANQRLMIVLPITILLIFVILYTMFKSFKWAGLILVTVAIAPIGGLLALSIHWDKLQRLLRRRLPRPVRRLRANRGHHAGIHQPATLSALHRRRRSRRRRRAPPAPHHDDYACRHPRTTPRRALPRHRLRFAAPLRHRHRWRSHRRPDHQRLSLAHPLRLDRRRTRRPAPRRRRLRRRRARRLTILRG